MRRNVKRTKRSKTKRQIHSKMTLEIDSVPVPSAGDDTSQAGTTETVGDRQPSRTEEVDYITIDDEELEELEEEVHTQSQMEELFFQEVNRDFNRVNQHQPSQEEASVTLDDSVLILPQADDSFMEDSSNSHSIAQDDSIDGLLNDTITIDDPTVDNSEEEHEVIDLTTGPADPQVSPVLPSLNETVEEEICPVCHDTLENIQKEGKRHYGNLSF